MKMIRMGFFVIGMISFFFASGFAEQFYDIDNPDIRKTNIFLNTQKNTRLNGVFAVKLKHLLEKSLMFRNVDTKSAADIVLEMENSVDEKEIIIALTRTKESQSKTKYFGQRFRETGEEYILEKAAQMGNKILNELFDISGSLGSTLVWSNLEGKQKIMYRSSFGLPEKTEQISFNLYTNYGASWNPEKDTIVFTSHTVSGTVIMVQQLDPLRYKSVPIYEQAGKASSPVWASDGTIFLTIHISDQNSDIVQYSLQGKPYSQSLTGLKMIRKWTYNPTIETEPQISPDGSTMAYVSDQTGSPQIYLLDLSSAKSSRLTKKGGYNVTPFWSPNGKFLAYRGIRKKISSIYRIDVKKGVEKRITPESIDAESATWSPDGALIAFAGIPRQADSDISKIYVMLASGGEYRRLSDSAADVSESNPSWGPALR